MGVEVYRDADAGVAQPLRRHLHMGSIGKQLRGVGVSEKTRAPRDRVFRAWEGVELRPYAPLLSSKPSCPKPERPQSEYFNLIG